MNWIFTIFTIYNHWKNFLLSCFYFIISQTLSKFNGDKLLFESFEYSDSTDVFHTTQYLVNKDSFGTCLSCCVVVVVFFLFFCFCFFCKKNVFGSFWSFMIFINYRFHYSEHSCNRATIYPSIWLVWHSTRWRMCAWWVFIFYEFQEHVFLPHLEFIFYQWKPLLFIWNFANYW